MTSITTYWRGRAGNGGGIPEREGTGGGPPTLAGVGGATESVFGDGNGGGGHIGSGISSLISSYTPSSTGFGGGAFRGGGYPETMFGGRFGET